MGLGGSGRHAGAGRGGSAGEAQKVELRIVGYDTGAGGSGGSGEEQEVDLGGSGRDNGAGGGGGAGKEQEVELRRSGCNTGAGSAGGSVEEQEVELGGGGRGPGAGNAGGDGACCSTTSASAAGSSSTTTAQRRDTAETRGTGARDSSGRGEEPDADAIAGHVPAWNATSSAPSSASLDGVAQQEEAQRQRGRRQGASVRHCNVLPEEAQEHHHEGQAEAPSPPPFRWPLLVAVVRCVGEPGLNCSHHQRPAASAASTTAPSSATAFLHLLQSLQEGQQEPPHPLRGATAAATPASTHSPI